MRHCPALSGPRLSLTAPFLFAGSAARAEVSAHASRGAANVRRHARTAARVTLPSIVTPNVRRPAKTAARVTLPSPEPRRRGT